MRVLLIDVDSKIPNLALMKISAYHKARGDVVGFNVENPDYIYASVVFKKNRHKIGGLPFLYPNCKIDVGGSGVDLAKTLPPEVESLTPDYSLYPACDRYYGFTTRGCVRNYPFCIVPTKEGKFRKVYPDTETALSNICGDYKFNKIEFLDNNILASKDWFMDLSERIPKKWKVDFNQGLDVRLLDSEIATQLAKMRPITCWKFAYDNTNYTKSVFSGIDILEQSGIDIRHKIMFYVYCDNDSCYEDAVSRCRALKNRGVTAYIMINQDVEQTQRLKNLKRWCRPWIYWKIDIDEYGGIA